MTALGVGSVAVILGVVLAIAVAAGIAFLIYMRICIKVARADEALVISGGKKGNKSDGTSSNVDVVVNGRALVNPLYRRHEIISLRSRQVDMNIEAQSSDNVTLTVDAVAMVKIGSQESMVRAAAERFASQDKAIERFTTEQLEGALRGVVAQLSVQSLMRDRKELSDKIASDVTDDLNNQGLVLDSFSIKGITDGVGYISSLGKPEIEAKRQAAEISKSMADRAIKKQEISVNEANLVEETAYKKNEAMAKSETGRAEAEAEKAKELAQAEAAQKVLLQEAENKQAQLDAEIKKVADAERYEQQQRADAAAYAKVKAAEASKADKETQAAADKSTRQLRADAEAYEIKAQASARKESAAAEAEAVRVAAEAKADAIRLEGEAKADAIKAEAEAIRENQDAILAKELIGQLPALMEKFAEGYSKIGNITLIGGSDSNHMNGQSATAVAGVFETVKAATGVDLGEIIQGKVTGRAIGEGISSKDS